MHDKATPLEQAEAKRPWTGLGRTTLSLSVGSYKPNLDANTTFPVYDCMFSGSTLPLIGGAGDVHLWDGFGSLQFSTGLGITQASGFAQPPEAAASGNCEKATTTKVQASFAVLRAGLTYRFDPLLDLVHIPLVPYGRVGLVGMGYVFTKNNSFASTGDRINPVGVRYGYEAAVGLMLALDFLDKFDPFAPDVTRRARANGIFDHTFIYVEGATLQVNSFGAAGFDLSSRDDFLNSGLPASFTAGVAVELL